MSRVFLLPTLLLLYSPAPRPVNPAAPPSISSLSWLEGVWSGRVGMRDFEARYTSPSGGLILSMSKYTLGGKAVEFEFEQFDERDGTLMLTPYPQGKKSAVTFRLTVHDPKARRAVFENPAHDFPTKLSYQRVAEDSLTILVSGPGKDGKEKVIRYELKAVRG